MPNPYDTVRTVDVEVICLVTSPGHSYWFHHRDPAVGIGPHPTLRPAQVEVVADQGVVGDRFFGQQTRLASPMSFVAAEAVEAVEDEVGLPRGSLDPALMRRTVVVRGVDLNALRHQRFGLDSGAGPVWFQAGGETAPCAWMDAQLAPGARLALRGRGGLRVCPTTSGVLRIGPARLLAGAAIDPAQAGYRHRDRA